MKKIFETQGTCSKAIALDVDETTGIINDVQFMGGCPGNTIGVAALVKGQKISDVLPRIKGINCGGKGTSCPDQLALALETMMNN